eukprot:3791147-Pleurochrysis_carterae.AAC.1
MRLTSLGSSSPRSAESAGTQCTRSAHGVPATQRESGDRSTVHAVASATSSRNGLPPSHSERDLTPAVLSTSILKTPPCGKRLRRLLRHCLRLAIELHVEVHSPVDSSAGGKVAVPVARLNREARRLARSGGVQARPSRGGVRWACGAGDDAHNDAARHCLATHKRAHRVRAHTQPREAHEERAVLPIDNLAPLVGASVEVICRLRLHAGGSSLHAPSLR